MEGISSNFTTFFSHSKLVGLSDKYIQYTVDYTVQASLKSPSVAHSVHKYRCYIVHVGFTVDLVVSVIVSLGKRLSAVVKKKRREIKSARL